MKLWSRSSVSANERRVFGYAPLKWIRLTWLRPGLFALGTIVVAAFAIYTVMVIRTLRQDAQRIAKLYAEQILPRAYTDPGVTGAELRVLFDLIQEMPVSVVVTDQDGTPILWKGIAVPDTARSAKAIAEVRSIAARMDKVMPPREVILPVGNGSELRRAIHVAESPFLWRIAWMPFVATVVTLIFTGVAFWGFLKIKTGEQQALWVGMAKETAHQLGTPLSSLSGWLEILAEERASDGKGRRRSDTVVREMTNDIERLRKIAQRFGQVGSYPELHRELVTPVIDETLSYFQTRMPRLGRDIHIERDYHADEEIPLNRELLGWTFENLFRNSLDALSRAEGGALIRVTTERMDRWLRILFEDNGKGISPKDLDKMFLPGFSTKKRGWGLGLTFAKRIIEDYHGGKIGAHSAGPGQGMIIEIRLPINR